MGQYRNRVIFPELDEDGDIIYWQARSYLNREPKYVGPKGSRDFHVWNLNQVRGKYKSVNVLEGVLSGIACGLNSVALYSYGFLDSQVSLLADAGFEEYIICFDGHPKAWSQAAKLAASLADRGVKEECIKVVILPLGTDTSDLGPTLSHWYLVHAHRWNPMMITQFQTLDAGREALNA
jgi:DNA primase